MQYLRILIAQNNYVQAAEVLRKETEFLLQSEKCKKDGISVYIMDLMLVDMITPNLQAIDAAVGLRRWGEQSARVRHLARTRGL